MKIVADLPSIRTSRATSKNLTFEHLSRWAQLKGVHVVGTGDVAHPGWLKEMREKLVPAEEGLFRLRDELADAVQATVPPACRGTVRFMLGGEISNIYKRAGRSGETRTRKVHNVVFAPSFEAVERLQARLEKIGNIRADGRPILGLDSRDLLETMLDADSECRLIPAHIWTPWFSLLGSKSGFDSIEECWRPDIAHLRGGDRAVVRPADELARLQPGQVRSSPTPMRIRRRSWQRRRPCSTPSYRMGPSSPHWARRSACVRRHGRVLPEEGKYHLDGHRKCGVVWSRRSRWPTAGSARAAARRSRSA